MQLHSAVAEMEKEKFELQKQHTETIQELLEDTNMRLSKMEGDYMVQTQSTVSVGFSVRLCTAIFLPMPHASRMCAFHKLAMELKEERSCLTVASSSGQA